jgi:hypothetical protein
LDTHAASHAALSILGTATSPANLRVWSLALLATTSADPPGSQLP